MRTPTRIETNALLNVVGCDTKHRENMSTKVWALQGWAQWQIFNLAGNARRHRLGQRLVSRPEAGGLTRPNRSKPKNSQFTHRVKPGPSPGSLQMSGMGLLADIAACITS
jgi:hypothetical protein